MFDVRVKWKISCQWYINFWLRMMYGHGTNPVFFNKKKKELKSRTLTNLPSPYVRQHLIFTLHPPLICVSPFILFFPFSFDLSINRSLRLYSFIVLSFVSFPLTLSISTMPKYVYPSFSISLLLHYSGALFLHI